MEEEEDEEEEAKCGCTASRRRRTRSRVRAGEDRIGRKSRKTIPGLGKSTVLTIAALTRDRRHSRSDFEHISFLFLFTFFLTNKGLNTCITRCFDHKDHL